GWKEVRGGTEDGHGGALGEPDHRAGGDSIRRTLAGDRVARILRPEGPAEEPPLGAPEEQGVLARFPGQLPLLLGRAERRLFGGPFRPQDPGYPITREGAAYRISAGTMIGLTEGASVAVFGPTPDFFPSLGSPDD